MLNVSLNLPPRNPPSSHSPPSTPVGSPSDAILGLQPVEPLSTIHIPLHFPTSAEFSQTDPTFHTSPQNAISTALSLVQSKVVNALAMKNLTKDEAMAEMSHFLDRIGVDEPALKSMNFVHLAGSKGKGSTSSYIESILHQHGFKTGLFTSPHLINPTERFRINTETVNNDDFAKYFWEVWDRLISTIPNHYQTAQTQGTNNIAQHPSQQQTASSTSPSGQRFSPLPPYFTLLTLVSFHMFKQKKLDVVVLEVGLGGKLDSTNIIPNPLVTGVTTLSMEHSEILGDTLGKIAGEKCGVFKPGSDIVVFPQKDEAWNVILRESQKVNQTPILINTDTLFENMELGIEGDYQKKNANMALILSLIAMKKLREKGVKPTYATGNNQLSQEASADLPRDALTSVMDIAKLQTFDQLATFSSEMTINHQIKSKVRRESQHDATHQAKLRKGEEVERVDNFFEHQLDPEYIDTVFDFMPSTEANGNNNINSNHALTDPEQTNNPHVTKLSKTIANLKRQQQSTSSPSISVPFLSADKWIDQLSADLDAYLEQAKHFTHQTITKPLNDSPSLQLKGSSITPHSTLNYPMFHINTLTPQALIGLCSTRLRGRCDRFVSQKLPNLKWFIDGAHTPESILSATKWFREQSLQDSPSLSPLTDHPHSELISERIAQTEPCTDPFQKLKHFTPLFQSAADTFYSESPQLFPQSHDLHNASASDRNSPDLGDQVEEDQRILLFNCGHVRSPFVLMSPMIEQLYSPLNQLSHSKPSKSSSNQEKQTATPAHPPHDAHNNHQSTSSSAPDQSFEHVFFCPFDQDKPHPLPFPSLAALFTSDNNQTVPIIRILHPHSTDPTPSAFSHLPPTLHMDEFQSLLESHTFDTFEVPPLPSPTNSTSKPKPPSYSALVASNSMTSSTPIASNLQSVKWQLTNMVIMDFLTSQRLSPPQSSQPDASATTSASSIKLPPTITSTSTLSLLKSTHHFPNPLSNNPNFSFYSNHTYSNMPFELQHPSATAPSNFPPPNHPSPITSTNPAILPFHPPIATITRHFVTSDPLAQTKDKTGPSPIKSFQFHVMPTTRDAILAIKHLHHQRPLIHTPQKQPRDTQHPSTASKPPQSNKQAQKLRKAQRKTKVFVTGSLYLVGNSLRQLKAKV